MKQISTILTIFTALTIISCDNGRADKINTQAVFPVANQSAAVMNTTAQLNPAHGEPGHRCDIAVGDPLNDTSKPANITTQGTNSSLPVIPTSLTQKLPQQTTTAGLNPEHGKPGHRCDIAVGAPLDSKPTQSANSNPTITANTPPLPINVNPQPAAQKAAPGMNPAHGQPGHRCDIAVGAPLDSKPAQNPLPLKPPAVPITPVKTDSSNS